jgi:hypothetical protein
MCRTVSGSPGGRTALLVAILVLAGSGAWTQPPSPPPAPPPDAHVSQQAEQETGPLPRLLTEYLSLGFAYRKGRATGAVEEIRRWSEERLTTAVQLLHKQGISPCPGGPDDVGLDQVEAAMLLHVDAGFISAAGMEIKLGRLHHRVAERLLADARTVYDSWQPGLTLPGCLPPRPMSGRDFDVLLATGLLAVWDRPGAAPYAARAARGAPNDAEVLLVAGCAQESQASLDEIWGRSGVAQRRLADAERLFQRAVDRNPGLTEARLRLGRVMSLRGWTTAAEAMLSDLAHTAADPRQRYLAALFLGWVYERRHRVAEAEAAYRLAVETLPTAQTSRVALAALLDRGGDATLAPPILLPDVEGSSSKAEGEEPWAAYLSGPFWIGLDIFREAWQRVEVP